MSAPVEAVRSAVSVRVSAVRHQVKGPASAPVTTEREPRDGELRIRVQRRQRCGRRRGRAQRAVCEVGSMVRELGSAIVEGGAATGAAKTVGPDGSVSDGGSRGMTGYSIVSAESLDSAVELAKGCQSSRSAARSTCMRRSRCNRLTRHRASKDLRSRSGISASRSRSPTGRGPRCQGSRPGSTRVTGPQC